MRATRLGVGLVGLLCFLSAGALSAGIQGAASAFYSPMTTTNLLIDEYEAFTASSLGRMGAGFSFQVAASLAALGERLDLGFGGRAAFAGAAFRVEREEVRVSASLAGVFLRLGYELGEWGVGLDVGAYRGAFSFPSARYVGLSGWGPGICLDIVRRVGRLGQLSVNVAGGVRWLPIQEMTDSSGQRRVGRGAPFLDFSGLSISVECSWSDRRASS